MVKNVNWIEVAQVGNQWWALMNVGNESLGAINSEEFLDQLRYYSTILIIRGNVD
jgi:hypothetical protein